MIDAHRGSRWPGARLATVHMYQRGSADVPQGFVFGFNGDGREQCKGRRGAGPPWPVMKFAESYLPGTDFGYEYSPEIFMDTELRTSPWRSARRSWTVWQPGPDREIVLNLPCTVEGARRRTSLRRPDRVDYKAGSIEPPASTSRLSVHTHNDRGNGHRRRPSWAVLARVRIAWRGCLFGKTAERVGPTWT